MVRIEALRSLFGKTKCVVKNRYPGAFCSSTFFQNTPNIEQLEEADRLQNLQRRTMEWVNCSNILKE